MRITVESKVHVTPRTEQVRGLFDIPESKFQRHCWDIDADAILGDQSWRIGLITGPSGCGKSTIAGELFEPSLCLWPHMLPEASMARAVVDELPTTESVRTICELLSSVGLSSPPSWLKPLAALSTGQRFRAELARLLAYLKCPDYEPGCGIAACDEFTSVVDRTVAKVGSAAVAKTVRRHGLRFVAVTCHEDVIDWLQPDWVLTPEDGRITRRSVQPRPGVELEVHRTTAAAWPRFAPHHYLSSSLNKSAVCFAAVHDEGGPVAFSAWVPHLSAGGGKREHRTVVLPDWQGIGIGMRVSTLIASAWKGIGQRARSTTTHPAFIESRKRSPDWRMNRPPSLAATHSKLLKHATTRLTAGFEYVGPAMDTARAIRLIGP